MYDCLRDAEFRLNGTIVMYKGVYKYVKDVTKVGGVILLTLHGKLSPVPLSNPNLRIRSIKTGYLNVMGVVSYLSRRPARRYRQGLRKDNCEFTQGRNYAHFQHWVIEGGCEETPLQKGDLILSKDFAVVKGVLYYRAREVGIFQGVPMVTNRFNFLKEALAKVLSSNTTPNRGHYV